MFGGRSEAFPGLAEGLKPGTVSLVPVPDLDVISVLGWQSEIPPAAWISFMLRFLNAEFAAGLPAEVPHSVGDVDLSPVDIRLFQAPIQ